MSDKPEPLSAILAEMREWSEDENDALSCYADRIEVAAKRDEDRRRDEVLSLQRTIVKMQDAIARQADAVNAAALRKALESIEDDCRVLDRKDMWEEEGECYYDALRDIREKVSAAIAAPARNCDRFDEYHDAVDAWHREERCLGHHEDGGTCAKDPLASTLAPVCFARWLFDKAEGGAE